MDDRRCSWFRGYAYTGRIMRMSLFVWKNRPSNLIQILDRIEHPTATQREGQTVLSDVMRQFLFIQLKYDTICCRTLGNFNSSPRLIHVHGTSENSWVNLSCFICHAKCSANLNFSQLTATYLRYIKVKFNDINKFISFKYFVLCVIILW